MVGPSLSVWKVLRETEGERFVAKNKVRDSLRDLPLHKNKFRAQQFILNFENVLYAIRYPVATEMFANQKVAFVRLFSVNLYLL
jgi:hypothetical protein